LLWHLGRFHDEDERLLNKPGSRYLNVEMQWWIVSREKGVGWSWRKRRA
jgi:hypothetical protein